VQRKVAEHLGALCFAERGLVRSERLRRYKIFVKARAHTMAYQFGPFRYDPVSRCLIREDREIALKPKTRELLVLFLQNPHRLLTRDDIAERIWPNTAVTDDSLRVQVFDLRKALGADAERMIKTVPREGYRWEIDVRSGGAGRGDADADLVFRIIVDGRENELSEGENVLGRDRGVAVWIDETAVSRHHSRIVGAGGRATLEDLGSKNGTYLRGRRIATVEPLTDGDEIRIGSAAMRVRAVLRRGSTETEERAK
jgi:DNA-binding winged helix-turn-helix (wHTH) protein